MKKKTYEYEYIGLFYDGLWACLLLLSRQRPTRYPWAAKQLEEKKSRTNFLISGWDECSSRTGCLVWFLFLSSSKKIFDKKKLFDWLDWNEKERKRAEIAEKKKRLEDECSQWKVAQKIAAGWHQLDLCSCNFRDGSYHISTSVLFVSLSSSIIF